MLFQCDEELILMSFFARKGIPPRELINLSEEEYLFYRYTMKQDYDFELEKIKFWSNFWVKTGLR